VSPFATRLPEEHEKRAAAEVAATFVESGMAVGLGTGSTVAHLLPALASRNLAILCVATSPATERAARRLGLHVQPFDGTDRLDLAIDGADQVDRVGWLVKGGGRAHTREKIVAAAARRFVVIVSSDKIVDGLRSPVPLEILPFGAEATLRSLGPARLRPGPPTPDGGLIAERRRGALRESSAMKALAVYPGLAHSLHLKEVPAPRVSDVPDGRGVLVKVLRVGLDGTDREINAAEYGAAPPSDDFLITGHENFGQVVEVGPNVPRAIVPGAYVVATVRRPGSSVYDRIGLQDMTTDDVYYERGINLLHGYLAEYYVEDASWLVPVPTRAREVGVLLEPLTIAEKGIHQAFEIQRRLKVWEPRRAAVLGSGTIGLLLTLALRLRGLDVTCYSLPRAPYLNSDLIEAIGGRYVSARRETLGEAAARFGPFDLIFEATGHSPMVFEAAEALGRNGVLVLASITGGTRRVEVNADAINQGFVLGNKVMVGTVNASRDDFVRGVDDLIRAETLYPGWLGRLLTTPVRGLENYPALIRSLVEDTGAIKVYVELDWAGGNA
jgi:threonine dehydrogenase-like Zn-dependent dehydrogenase